MRILFAHNRYKNLGGEELAATVEMRLIRDHGHSTECFQADNAEIDGLTSKVEAAWSTVYSRASRRTFAEKIASFKPDVVHVFNFFPLLSPSIHYACREAGVPVIQKISNFRLICPGALLSRDGKVCEECVGKTIPWPGVIHACYRNSYAGSAVVATMLTVHNFLGTWTNVVDAFIARTNFSRDKLVEGGLPANKIHIIPSFAPDPGNPIDGGGKFVLFAGRLSAEKGISTLLSAWQMLKGSGPLLKVAGDGPLKEEVARHADGKRIEYLGMLPRAEVQALMREAAFLVFPSICYENFPLSIVEAFASGVPVIASKLGAMGEIIEDRRTGLHYQPGDAEDLAAKIGWATSHPSEMAEMRREARTEYLSKYTPEHNYDLIIKLYTSVSRRQASPRP